MKTMKKEGKIIRVKDSEAFKQYEKEGWAYIPKSVWKKEVRDVK